MSDRKRILRGFEIWGRPGHPGRSGLSRVTIWRLERQGRFPPSVRLGPGSKGYDEAEFEKWLSDPPTYRACDDG